MMCSIMAMDDAGQPQLVQICQCLGFSWKHQRSFGRCLFIFLFHQLNIHRTILSFISLEFALYRLVLSLYFQQKLAIFFFFFFFVGDKLQDIVLLPTSPKHLIDRVQLQTVKQATILILFQSNRILIHALLGY